MPPKNATRGQGGGQYRGIPRGFSPNQSVVSASAGVTCRRFTCASRHVM